MKKTNARKPDSEPTSRSLKEIPELDFSTAIVLGRGHEGLKRARVLMNAKRGRPRKGARPDGSTPRSIRFSDRMWRDLERRAKRRHVSLHALLREVIADWLTRAA